MRKNENGITLIALVITIIVLLILAGVTMSMVVGNNGVLTNAQNAREKQSLSAAEEKIKLKVAEAQTEYYANPEEHIDETLYEYVVEQLSEINDELNSENSVITCVSTTIDNPNEPKTLYHIKFNGENKLLFTVKKTPTGGIDTTTSQAASTSPSIGNQATNLVGNLTRP